MFVLRSLPYFTGACGGAYTVDFVLSPDLKIIRVIEVNNPPPVAGTSLFGTSLAMYMQCNSCNIVAVWDDPKDRDIIHNGPFTFRILERPVRLAPSFLPFLFSVC